MAPNVMNLIWQCVCVYLWSDSIASIKAILTVGVCVSVWSDSIASIKANLTVGVCVCVCVSGVTVLTLW